MSDVEWPWQYSFPPFFTLQPHAETREKQINAWRNLILHFCKTTKICEIDVREAAKLPLFNNCDINRTLDTQVVRIIMNDLEKTGHAAAVDKSRDIWQIYWFTLAELANKLYKWASDRGMQNSVCTLFEISEGDDAVGEEFYGISKDVLLKALEILQTNGKCELIQFEDNEGVKFF